MNPNANSAMIQNIPNASLMYQTYTPTFGNMNFMIQPSMTGEVSNTFATVPYMSLEALVYMQQMQAQTAPTSILPGQNTGNQNVNGQYTVTDASGNVRVLMGYSHGGF